MNIGRLSLVTAIVGVIGTAWSLQLLAWFMSIKSIQVCLLGSTCPTVFATSFSELLGVPIHLYAAIWFAALTVMAVARARGNLAMSLYGTVVGSFSIPAVAYLEYVQLDLIRAICTDCVIAHALGLILFGLFVVIHTQDRAARRRTV